MEPTSCPNCGHRIEEPGATSCPVCGVSLASGGPGDAGTGPGAPPLPPPPSGPGNSVPFEDGSQPFVQRFLRTAGMAFSDPMRLFSSMDDKEIGMPLLYGVIVGTITGVASILWNMMLGGMAMLGESVAPRELAFATWMYVTFMFIMPIIAAVGLFVSAAIFHLMLMILGDAERGFAVTFRAVAYGNTPTLLGLVPFCGGLIGGVWALVLVIIGGKIGHGTQWWKAILAYFLPLILCCCLGTWLLFMLGFLGAVSDS